MQAQLVDMGQCGITTHIVFIVVLHVLLQESKVQSQGVMQQCDEERKQPEREEEAPSEFGVVSIVNAQLHLGALEYCSPMPTNHAQLT